MEDLTPASVEFSGDGGLTLRGIRWGEAPAQCLLLHDIGGDLDMWDVIPAALAAAGMSALAIDPPASVHAPALWLSPARSRSPSPY